MSSASDDASAEAAAVEVESTDTFLAWASRHRRRAAHDGAWKVEVAERVLRCGARVRTVSSWHDAQKQRAPQRRSQHRRAMPSSELPASSHRAKEPQQGDSKRNSKQRKSARRSAAHHSAARLRVLRRVITRVLFYIRLWHTHMATLALREGPSDSPSKRRRSIELLDDDCAGAMGTPAAAPDVLDCSPPEPKRAAPSAPPPTGLRQGFLLGQ